VTSTALRESALDIAQPAIVMGGDDLRRKITSSIGETIATQPGVTATYFGPSSSRPVIRGLGGNRVLMLQDGVSALDVSSLSQDHAVTIESVLADQIEILRGPATLLFGSGAVGGVVNVVDGRIPTDFSEEGNRVALEARADSASEERTVVGRLDLGSQSFRVHVDGFNRETSDIDIPGYAFSPNERAEHLAEEPDEHFERGVLENSASDTRGGAFGFTAGAQDSFVGFAWSRFETEYGVPGGHEEHEEEESEEPSEEHAHESVGIDMRQDRFDLKAEQALSIGALERARVRASYNEYEHSEIEGGEVGTRFEQQGLDLRLHLDHAPLAGWKGTLGMQYADVDFTATGAEAFTPPSTTRQTSLFVFEKRELGEFAFEVGARLENQKIEPASPGSLADYDETALNVSSGAVWDFAEHYSTALNLTRSQRHPQSAELYANGAHLAIGRYEIGNPDLQEETANTIDLTLHRHADVGIHWSISAFYNDFKDYIYAQDTGEEMDELPVFIYGQADAEFYGFEGEVTLPLYTQAENHLEVRLASDYVRGRLQDGGNLPQLPPWRYGIELHHERGPLHIGLEVYRYDDQDKVAPNERVTAGYTMLDADLSYRVPLGRTHLLVFLRGSNLLDEDARRHTSPLKELAPLPGRSATVGVRMEM
jgi:iron complex outermembrane recepter protein